MIKYFILSLLLVLSACAQKKIVVQDSELVPLKRLDDAMSHTRVKGELSVLSFHDDRMKGDIVGQAKTGMMNENTPIFLEVSPDKYVKAHFAAGLMKRGVDTLGDSQYGVRGNIKKLWVWENANGWMPENSSCELDIEFEIVQKRTNAVRYRGRVYSNATGTNNIFDTTDANGPVLEACLNYVIEKFVQEPQWKTLLGFEILD